MRKGEQNVSMAMTEPGCTRSLNSAAVNALALDAKMPQITVIKLFLFFFPFH
jgi:hypothetical protein